jgi:hypothetical protein
MINSILTCLKNNRIWRWLATLISVHCPTNKVSINNFQCHLYNNNNNNNNNIIIRSHYSICSLSPFCINNKWDVWVYFWGRKMSQKWVNS